MQRTVDLISISSTTYWGLGDTENGYKQRRVAEWGSNGE